MNKLLSFSPEPFADLDHEAEELEFESMSGEWETDETEEEFGRRRRPRPSRGIPRGFSRATSVRRSPKARIALPPMNLSRTPPRLSKSLRPIPVGRLIPTLPFIPPLIGLRPNPLPAPPRDVPPADDNRHTEQDRSEGSGSPPNTQPSGEPGSEYIRWVQDCLNKALGLHLPIDGIMTRETRNAVRIFQERQGLPITGLVGPETQDALKSTSAGTSSAPANNTELTPETEWEAHHPSSELCPLCNRKAVMKQQLSFEPEFFAGNTESEKLETLDTEAFEQFQGETSTNSNQSARWIQESLNKILRMQLNVDGIIGSQTRSAIRSFQQKQGLVEDGIVGPKTEAAVIAALRGAHPPPTQYLLPYTTPALLTPPVNQSIQQAIYGWNQYKRQIEELPPDQRAILKGVGDVIIASHKPGSQPMRNVKVYGHADWDTPRNPQREQQMSEERALMVTKWLRNYVGSAIEAQIIWDMRGFGATELKAQPVTEENRKRNRRVEIWIPQSNNIRPACPCKPGVNGDFCKWLQASLNQTIGVRLPINGVFGIQTRSALRSFQKQKGLLPTENTDSPTLYALVGMGAPTTGCQPGGFLGVDPGPWWQDQAALQASLAAIIANRNRIKLRHLTSNVKGGFMYVASTEAWRGTPEQKALAQVYVAWQGKLKPQVSGPKTRRIQRLLELWEDLMMGEGDPSSINTYDNMVVTWGVGFAGGASLERLIANLFRKSCYAQNAFLSNGIGLTTDSRLAVVDEHRGIVVEDRQIGPGQRTTDARLVIKNDRRLVSLFANVAQGVGFIDVTTAADVRQAVVDAEFETLQTIPTGQILVEMVQSWDRQAIAVAGHNIHAGGKNRKALTWNTFKGLVDKTLRGVVATLGLFFGEPGNNGSIWVADGVTFKRIMKLGRGWGRQVLQGPYVIAYDGSKYEMLQPPSHLQGKLPSPPPGFKHQPWNQDYIYFKAKTCEKLKRPNSFECDIVADNLVSMAKITYPYETNVSCHAYYLVPRTWATKQ